MSLKNPLTLSESSVNLDAIAQIQSGVMRDLENPITYKDAAMMHVRNWNITGSSNDFFVTLRDEIIKEYKRSCFLNERKFKEEVNHVRHDLVGSLLLSQTDEPLSKLGLNSILTPDYVSATSRIVLELTTVKSEHGKALERAFKKKVLAYEQVLRGKDIRYGIIVVSSNSIYTNCHLRYDMVSELTRRCREGLDLEKKIEKLTGYRLNSGDDDDSEDMKLVSDCISEMKHMEKRREWDFNEDLEKESTSTLTKLDEEKAREILNKSWLSAKQMTSRLDEAALSTYLDGLRVKDTRKTMKRILPFPCILLSEMQFSENNELLRDEDVLSEENEESKALINLWKMGLENCLRSNGNLDQDTKFIASYNEAMSGERETQKHNLRKTDEFTDCLSTRELDLLALSGPNAKLRSEMDEVKEHNLEQKKSFDLDVNCEDIEEFFSPEVLTGSGSVKKDNDMIEKLISESILQEPRRKVSRKMDNLIQNFDLVSFSQLVSEICLELSYEYKTPHKSNRWSCKKMRNFDMYLLCRSTGSHIFFSTLTPRKKTHIWDTGRLGPSLIKTRDYIISDFCSLVEASLEHYIKAGPYTSVICAYMLQHFNVPFLTRETVIPPEYFKTVKMMFMLYYNNKMDAENMCLDMRYLYMKVFQKWENDPYQFIDRLPDVLRSRFSVYILKKVLWIMRYYREVKPKQVKIRGYNQNDSENMVFTNLRCIYHDSPLSIEQLVDSFYFGYTISKMKGKVGDRSFKIVKKIIVEEMWARSHIKEEKNILWSHIQKPKRQHWSMHLLKYMIDAKIDREKSIYGETVIDQLVDKISRDFSRKRFSDIASLKASSKEYKNPQINLPDKHLEDMSGKEYISELKKLNPKLDGKRPRVLTALIKLIKEFIKESRDHNPTMLKLLLFSLTRLNAIGYFYSDCFPKDQHGGDREIHVLEIGARIVQFFVERMAACMDKLFRSDSILNPSRKDGFMVEHEQYAQSKLGPHMTTCKSADATKWCQRHHVSKFYFMMNRLTDGKFNDLLYNTFSLWTRKRIAIPNELIDILHRAQFNDSDNETLQWLKVKFITGDAPFVCEDSNLIECIYSMMQGIWHKVSTVFHSLIQETGADFQRAAMSIKGMENVVTVIQGSDDSACAISHRAISREDQLFVHCLLKWKEEFSKYLSIWTSEAKSSIGTQLLIEYNSEWWFRGKVIRPTFRWVSACLETTVVENFYDRIQIFYDELSECVATGCSTLCASIIQKNQARLHYLMMGFSNHNLRFLVGQKLLEYPHPSLGYFPLEPELHCGLMGFDYNLFSLQKIKKLKMQCVDHEMLHPSTMLDYDDKLDAGLRKEMRSVAIKMGNQKLWKRIVDEVDLMTIEDCISFIKNNPMCLYQETEGWEEQEAMMVRKLFERGVRASLSSYQPTIRSAVSSSYLFNRPCINVNLTGEWNYEKMSLSKAIIRMSNNARNSGFVSDFDETLMLPLFPNQKEYENFFSYHQELLKGFSFQEVHYSRTSKTTVPIWGGISIHELSLMDIIKRQFFQIPSIQLSNTVFSRIWKETKAKYRFLRDTHHETMMATGLDTIQLFDFFNSASKKTRRMKMQDTTAKFPDIMSTITRVYWPQVKIQTALASHESMSTSLRHLLFCACTFFFSQPRKEEIISESLSKSHLSEIELRDVPVRSRKLKLIADFVKSNGLRQDKEKLIADTPFVKQGVFGYFVGRQELQKGRKGMQVRPKYTGEGVWIGTVSDVPVRITIKDQFVRLIEIKYMQDSVSLSKRLNKLLEEFQCEIYKKPQRSKSLYYLLAKGHFAVSPISMEDSVCVEINPDLDPPDLESLIKKEWRLTVWNTTIRISYIENNISDKPRAITILSDTLSLRDWISSYQTTKPKWIKDKLFLSYLMNEPVSPMDMMLFLRLNPNHNYMQNLLSRMGDSDIELQGISLREMSNHFTRHLVSIKNSEVEKRRYIDRKAKEAATFDKNAGISDAEVEEMLMFDENVLAVPTSGLSWADELNEEMIPDMSEKINYDELDEDVIPERLHHSLYNEDSSSDDDDLLNFEQERITNVVDMFYELNMDELITADHELEILRSMPSANQFWHSFIRIIESEEDGKQILDCITSSKMLPPNLSLLSHGAFICSLSLRLNLYGDLSEGLSTEMESEMSKRSKDPLATGEDISEHLQVISKEISEIDDALEGASPMVKKILLDKRKELSIRRDSYESYTIDKIFPSINYWWFMDNLIRQLKDKEIWDKSHLTSNLEPLVSVLLSDVLEAMASLHRMKVVSDSDYNAMKVRIWDRSVTSFLMRMVGTSLNFNGTWFWGKDQIYEHINKIPCQFIDILIPPESK